MSSKFIPPKIEHGIEMPPRSHVLYKWKGVLLAMKPGDSFAVSEYREKQAALRCAVYHRISVASRKINGSGFRIWRTQ